MNNRITITASNGKVLTGTLDNYAALVAELNAYEADLKLKKEKEEAERKAREEKQIQLAQYREKYLKEIDEATQKLQELIDVYEKLSGRKVIYVYDYDKKNYQASDTKNSIDFAYGDLLSEVFKAIRKV